MNRRAQKRFWSEAGRGKFAAYLTVVLIAGTMSCGKAWACEVMSVGSFKASAKMSGTFSTDASVCQCKFWVRVEWLSAGSGSKWYNDWTVEIWEPGEEAGPEEGHPPSGTMIASKTLPWNINPEDPQTGSSKVAVFDVDASGLSVGEHTLRAWVIRDGTNPPNAWEHSSPITVTVVEVGSVSETTTETCINTSVTFTANPNPSKTLYCLEWEKHYRNGIGGGWGPWVPSGTSTSVVLDASIAGQYQYQVRNCKDQVCAACGWKQSQVVDVVKVENVTFSPSALCADGSSTSTASATITPSSRTIVWSIQGASLGCSINSSTGVITAGTTAGTITVRAADSVLSSCYAEADIDVVKVQNVTFSTTALCADGSSTSTASATITPSSRTIVWSIQGASLGCSINSSTGVITAGTTGGTITVRAADSVLSSCYAEADIDVVKVGSIGFAPSGLCADGSSTSTASATITPSSRTIVWSIQGASLGCSINSSTGVITAGTTAGTITVRAADSVLSSCYSEAAFDILSPDVSGPDDVIIGDAFTITVSTGSSWNGTADITLNSGTTYSFTDKTESYWDTSHNTQTTPAYKHEFGVKLPSPATVTITNGSGSFSVTQFSMEAFSVKVTPQNVSGGCYDVYQATAAHVWAEVKATYIGDISLGPEEGHENDPGYFDNDLPRAALPYGATNELNSMLVVKKSLGDTGVDTKVRDRGPFFPYGASYPSNNDWYNEYWDDGGWEPLAEFMQGLIRVGDTADRIINGAGIDITKNAIESLGFTWSGTWSGTVYWRFE